MVRLCETLAQQGNSGDPGFELRARRATRVFECYLIWGNPRDFENRRVYCQSLSRQSVAFSAENQVLALDVGPVPIAGPIIHSEPAGVSPVEASSISVLVDTDIPSWIEPAFMQALGWQLVEHAPKPARYPFQVDVLLVSSNWTGSFDGWSSTQWFDASVKPLQRIPLCLDPDTPDSTITVHVLDVGKDVHGVGYAVVYAPDRDVVDQFQVTRHGWRREPIARLRRQAWLELADLSTQIEVNAVPVLGSAVVTDVVMHVDSPEMINVSALNHLPDDVFEAARERIEGAVSSDAPTGDS